MITVGHLDDQMSYLIDEHLDAIRGRLSRRTLRARRETLQRLHDVLPMGLAYAATEQIEAWLGQPGWSRATRSAYYSHVRKFYKWATERGDLDGDPSAMIMRPKHPRGVANPVTDEELAQALLAREPIRTAVLLAAYEGMRVSEAAAAHREHITRDIVLIPEAKGGDPQTVPTHPFVWEQLKDRPPGPLLLSLAGLEMSGDNLSAKVSAYFKRNGLPGVRMHRFRHWYGTTIQALYGDARVTQECLRHASLASTQIYTLVTDTRRRSAVASLPVVGTPAS